jgi:hypothetical protein
VEDKTFFTILVESPGPDYSFIRVFWAWADHLGVAIERVLRSCDRAGLKGAVAREADPYDFTTLPGHVTRDDKPGVFFDKSRHYFPAEESLTPPVGIIKSCMEGEFEDALIREGFSLIEREDGLHEVEVVVGRDRLFDTFVDLVKLLPSIRVFWVKLSADWEDAGREEFWVNEALNTPELIADYLKVNARDTVSNGHVTLTAYSRAGQTNLSIDSHKTIKVLTKSKRVRGRMAAALKRLGFGEAAELHSLEYGYYHWHYRPARSKSRARLVAALKRDGFSTWDPA